MQGIAYKFDVTNIDPYVGGGGAPLPRGWYLMPITNMEVKENNKKETGHNLFLEYTVHVGELKGRKHFENLNLWHTASSAAVEIAEKQLSSIGHAVNVLAGEDLTLLANKPMLVELDLTEAEPDKVDPNTGNTIKGRGPQNRIIQRKPATEENYALYIEGQAANSGAAPQFTQQPQAAAAAAAPSFAPASAPTAAPAAAAPAASPVPAASPAPAAAAVANASGAPAAPPWQRKAA